MSQETHTAHPTDTGPPGCSAPSGAHPTDTGPPGYSAPSGETLRMQCAKQTFSQNRAPEDLGCSAHRFWNHGSKGGAGSFRSPSSSFLL